MSTLEELSTRALSRYSSQLCLEYEKRRITWGEMRHVADRVNELIGASGANPHAPIAFVPRNRPSALAALLAMTGAGRNIRMIYAFQSSAALTRDMDRLKLPVIVAAAEDFTDEVRSIAQQRGIAAIALTEMEAAPVQGFERSTAPFDPIPGRPTIEVLTSGTTGQPKNFPLGFDMIAEHLVGINLLSTPEDTAGPMPTLLYFSLANISGIYATLPTLLRGIPGILLDRFNLSAWHEHVLKYRPAWGGLPPTGVQLVLDADIPPADLACMRFVATGSAPVDPTAQRAFEARYGMPVFNAYGATEFGGPVTAWNLELHAQWGKEKFGSVGRSFAGARLRAVNPETGSVLPPGQEGILEVISPRIGPEWIRTSDLGIVDADEFVWLRGRADGAIIRGGFKLLPETIERALLLHEAISGAAVVGVPDSRLGQVPAAAIQVKRGVAQPTIAELEKHLRNHLLATHIPVHWRFLESLPTTPSVKIDRVALRQMFKGASAS